MRREPVSTVFKEGDCAWAGGRDGGLDGGDHGLYAHDARWLRRFAWRWPDDLIELRLDARGPAGLRQRLARIEGTDVLGQRSPRDVLAVHRELRVRTSGVEERVVFEAGRDGPVDVAACLELEAIVEDVFEVRGFVQLGTRERHVHRPTPIRLEIATTAPDGVIDRLVVEVEADEGLQVDLSDERLDVEGTIPAAGSSTLRVTVRIERHDARRPRADTDATSRPLPARLADLGTSATADAPASSIPTPERWREQLVPVERRGRLDARDDEVALAAADDLRALLLPTGDGPVPAAGVPWYVAPFGRDALLTCLLVPQAADVTRATLRLLARLQGVGSMSPAPKPPARSRTRCASVPPPARARHRSVRTTGRSTRRPCGS